MKKFLSMLLLLAMLSGAFVACRGGENEVPEDSISGSQSTGEGTPSLPVKDYGGATFTIMCRSREMGWGEMAIVAEEDASTPISAATYHRNITVEDTYKIDLEFWEINDAAATGDSFYRTLQENSLAWDDICDICIPGVLDAALLAPEGLFCDLSSGEVPYVDLEAEWWLKRINDSLSILNKQFFAINDMLLNDKLDTYVMFFNKTVFDENQMDYPYGLVESNEWTLEAFNGIIKNYGQDLNYNDKPDYDDAYGLVGMIYDVFYIGAGITGAYLDEETGLPVITELTERMTNIYDTVYSIFNDALYTNYNIGQGLYENDIVLTFQQAFDQKSLFMCGPLNFYFTIIPNMESDVGIVPCPKYDSMQENYYSRAGYTGATVITILNTVQDKERAGLILEALGAESAVTVTPAFYETMLKDRYAQDDESKAMINLIIDSEIFDLDQIFKWGCIIDFFQTSAVQKSSTVASIYDRYKVIAENNLQTTLDAYLNLENAS